MDSGKIFRWKLKCDRKEKTSFSLRSIYRKIFKSEFEAHDAIEDVKALGRILLSESVSLSKRELTEFATELPTATEYISYLNTKREFEQGYHLHLKGMTQYMTTKLIESGITFEALRALYKHFGVPGIVGYLSIKSSDLKKVRVTKTIAALAKIICCLQKLPEFSQV